MTVEEFQLKMSELISAAAEKGIVEEFVFVFNNDDSCQSMTNLDLDSCQVFLLKYIATSIINKDKKASKVVGVRQEDGKAEVLSDIKKGDVN